MQNAICTVSVAAVRSESSHESTMISQLLYGEVVEVLEAEKHFVHIRIPPFDDCGWVDSKQISIHVTPSNSDKRTYVVDELFRLNSQVGPSKLLSLGSELEGENEKVSSQSPKQKVVQSARVLLGVPDLKGGRSAFGLDSSALVQLCYKVGGVAIERHCNQQALRGEVLSFVEEAEPGDLAFFENKEREIVHVGVVMEEQKVLHSYGEVRMDLLDSTGIYNADLGRHTHKLRFIKRLLE